MVSVHSSGSLWKPKNFWNSSKNNDFFPQHKLIQDAVTRQNLTFSIKRSCLSKGSYCMLWHFENEIDGFFSHLEQTLMETLVNVLRPFEQATRELTAETAQSSQVIPAVLILWLLMQGFSTPPLKSCNKESYLFPKHLGEIKKMVQTV